MTWGAPSLRTLLIVGFLVRAALIAYSEWYDALPSTKVKYTDIDYRVFSDAARFLYHTRTDLQGATLDDNVAQGLIGSWLNLGDPYLRATYRYTPLLALLLTPNVFFHGAFGKVLFATCDIVVARLLDALFALVNPGTDGRLYIGVLWLFNPIVIGISTRGSAEALVGVLVLATLYSAMLAVRQPDSRFATTAVWLALAVHVKIYPFIYGASLLALLAGRGPSVQQVMKKGAMFALAAAGALGAITLSIYMVWGFPFLEHAYLYHIGRRDHRHNFSPYFYPTYLSYPGLDSPSVPSDALFSFLPQLVLSVGSGFLLGRRTTDLPFAFFVQTVLFVTFNKVCTSQYFMWYMWFLPLVIPRLRLAQWEKIALPAVWVGSQAVWLGTAYQLEFESLNVFKRLWVASLAFMFGNCWVLARMMAGYAAGKESTSAT